MFVQEIENLSTMMTPCFFQKWCRTSQMIHPVGLEPLDERIQDSQSLCEVHGQQSFREPKSTTGTSKTNQPSIGQFGWWFTRHSSETVCRFKLQHCDTTQEQNFKEFARSKVNSKCLQRPNVATSNVASKTWWWFGSCNSIAKDRVRRYQTFNACHFATAPGCLTLAIGCALTGGIRVCFCCLFLARMKRVWNWCNKRINETWDMSDHFSRFPSKHKRFDALSLIGTGRGWTFVEEKANSSCRSCNRFLVEDDTWESIRGNAALDITSTKIFGFILVHWPLCWLLVWWTWHHGINMHRFCLHLPTNWFTGFQP